MSVESGGNAFDDGYFIAGFKFAREGFADLPSARPIVGADKWNCEARLLQHLRIQFVVDVHHQDATVFGSFQHGDQRL